MWMLKTKDGLEVTEREVKFWDNLPSDIEITALAVSIPRNGAKPYTVEVRDYEEVCVGNIGSAVPGAGNRIIGFVIFAVARDHVTEFSIYADGIRMKGYSRDQLTLRPEALRRMVT
jgi:hypothetical protein